MAWILFWAAGVVNGMGHFWGYRNYDCDDASHNLPPWGILIGGEELHNNHHSQGDVGQAVGEVVRVRHRLDGLSACSSCLGWAKVEEDDPRPRFGEAKPVPDLDTLQAIVTHR